MLLGTWKVGAILLSLSVLYGDEGIAHRFKDSEPRLIVTDPANAERMPGDLVDEVIVLDESLLADADDDDRGKPLSVGFWFSLGHSTIVFGLTFLLSVGLKALAGPVTNDDSALHSSTGVIGASVSGVFLWVLGILNLIVLMGIVSVFRRMRAGEYDEAELDAYEPRVVHVNGQNEIVTVDDAVAELLA